MKRILIGVCYLGTFIILGVILFKFHSSPTSIGEGVNHRRMISPHKVKLIYPTSFHITTCIFYVCHLMGVGYLLNSLDGLVKRKNDELNSSLVKEISNENDIAPDKIIEVLDESELDFIYKI